MEHTALLLMQQIPQATQVPHHQCIEVTVDTIPPAAPVITDPQAGLQNTAISEISGTAENDATVQVFDGSTDLGYYYC